jgi:mono/diheme cytochrome c family protein
MRTLSRILAVALLAVAVAPRAPAAAGVDAHASALAALADVRASLGEIVRIEDGYAVGHGAYLRAAHRALNAIVGRRDDGYVASFGDPGDGVGTLGHLDAMLDSESSWFWTPAITGAKANVLAAADNISDSMHEKQMEDYQADLTHAIANLALVTGRASQGGVFGGLSGALANTSLGVPAGAPIVSGCRVPARAPAYGVVDGRLAYVAVPRGSASEGLPQDLSVSRILVRGDDLVLYTAAAADAASLCRQASQRERPVRERTRDVVAGSLPALYTAAQAHAGAAVYQKYCIQCHGADLQGTAGPGIAGTEFLNSAKGNRWTLSDVRTTIFENMPFSNPGSLSPKQYAAVTAFLLASNCYPAGATPFPTVVRPVFAQIKIGPARSVRGAAKTGVCIVK